MIPNHTDSREHIAIMSKPELIRLLSEINRMHWLYPACEKRMKELKQRTRRKTA